MPSILIVDNETAIATMCGNFLESAGFNIATASSAEEALKYRERFDLALLDVVMPGCTGVELAKELQKKNPQMKIIFMSGNVFDVSLPNGSILLEKPFTLSFVEKQIRESLGSPIEQTYIGNQVQD